MSYTIDLQKESFKFSGSHFTIFNAQHAERLHGHNYYVTASFEVEDVDPKVGLTFDFNTVKPLIKSLCEELDEYVLIPAKSAYVTVEDFQANWIVRFAQKTYSFPKFDVRLLPIVNITSEALANYLCSRLIELIPRSLKIRQISLCVKETQGQSVTYVQKLEPI